MSGSVEVRKFLFSQDEGSTRGGVPVQRSGDPSRISEEQMHRARLSVARSALNAEDCRHLLEMLGLAPDEEGVPPVRR